jgi:hypothetical protein
MISAMPPRILHQPGSRFDPVHAVVDQALDLPSRTGGTLSQIAHFACHDSKASPLLASTGGLHGGVQRQQVV